MIYDGSKNVAAAGTREALTATRTPASWVNVQAKVTNTGAIWLGGTTIAANRGIRLDAGDGMFMQAVGQSMPYDLATVYIDAAVSGEGVTFAYFRN